MTTMGSTGVKPRRTAKFAAVVADIQQILNRHGVFLRGDEAGDIEVIEGRYDYADPPLLWMRVKSGWRGRKGNRPSRFEHRIADGQNRAKP